MASHQRFSPSRPGHRLPLRTTRRVLVLSAGLRLGVAVGALAAVAVAGAADGNRAALVALIAIVAIPWHLLLLREALQRARWPLTTGPIDAVITAGIAAVAPTDAWPLVIALLLATVALECTRGGFVTGWSAAVAAVLAASAAAVVLEPPAAPLSIVALATGAVAVVVVVAQLADERELSLRRLGLAIDGSASVVWEADAAENRMAFISGNIRRLLGYGPWELAHRRIRWGDIVHPDDVHLAIDVDAIDSYTWPHVREFRMRTRDGSWIWLRDTVRAERRPDGAWALRGVATDVTAARHAADRVAHLDRTLSAITDEQRRDRELQRREALHDPLTGLPNRSHLMEHLRMLIGRGDEGVDLALLVLDLDQFKEVNDTLGHHYGDEMLREVAARLAGMRRGDDLLARLGGDEFAILLGGDGATRAERVAAEIVASVRRPLTLRGLQVQVGSSIGIARHPSDGSDPTELLQRAEVAMYHAKNLRHGWTWYAPELDRFSVRRLRLLGELPRALSRDELVVHYQPKIDLESGTVVGVEALVRWQHPELGMISPDEFIELTEVSGLVTELTRQVLRRTVAQLAEWDTIGVHLGAAVNVSVRDFHDDRLVPFIVDTLDEHGIEPGRLMLEITESQVVDDIELTSEVLRELSMLGVRTAIDDFGTGYSSLTHLRQLPVAEIKIDRSFVGQMATNQNDAVIVRSIVELGHNLDLEVVAEGVEDEWTLDNLRGLRCDRAQGYYFQPPVSPEEIPRYVGELAGLTP